MIEWLKVLRLRLRAAFRRRRLDDDLRDELLFHVEMREQQLRREGAIDTKYAARRRFGNVTAIQEECRETWTFAPVERLLADFRYSARSLLKKPGFTLVCVLILALGIGANSAVFSAIDAVLLRPLPFPDADRLMVVEQFKPKVPNFPEVVAPLRLADWDKMNSTFQSITGYYTEDVSETSGKVPEKVTRAWVAPRFFQTWAVGPILGREFTPEEETSRGPRAVVISDRFWRRRFAFMPNAVGSQLRIEKGLYTIVGVMPAGFLFPNRAVDLWTPTPLDSPYSQSRESTWFKVIGRMKNGFAVDQGEADLIQVQAQLGMQYPKTDGELSVRIRPLKDVTIAGAGRSLWILYGSVSLLLLIACTNIAALLLARSSDREQEISIRLSLGASRISVLTRLLAEVFLLALVGSILGLMVAVAASGVFKALAKELPRVEEIRLNWDLVLYSLACAIGATFVCGILPAIRTVRRSVATALSHTSRAQVSTRSPLQWLLVGMQVALSVTLLVGAGLLLRSFQELGRVSPGFDPDHVLTFRISGNWAETVDLRLMRQRINGTLSALRTLPGVEGAATALGVPGVASLRPGEFRIVEGTTDSNQKILATSRVVSDGYFATMRIPLLAGESCPEGDPAIGSALVNRSFADRYMSGLQVIGYHIVRADRVGPSSIVGMVGDAREEGLNHEPVPTVYFCNSGPVPSPLFVARTTIEPLAMAETIRAKINEIEPNRSVYEVIALEDHLAESFAENRLRMILLTFFAVTAVTLACLGVYGTLSYLVNMRRREVGLRIALGAARSEIVSHFVALGLRVCIIGCVAGIALAAVLSQGLSGFLYGVSWSDPMTFAGVIALVFVTGALASLLPAIRAARVVPMQVLRDE